MRLRDCEMAAAVAVAILVTCAGAIEHTCVHDGDAVQRMVRDSLRRENAVDGLEPAARSMRAAEASGLANTQTAPIRFVLRDLDLFRDGHFCGPSTTSVPDYAGGTIACTEATRLTPAKRAALTDHILPAAFAMLAPALRVNRSAQPIRVPARTCSNRYLIPDEDSTAGVADADFVLYVSGAPTAGKTIAFAGPCARSSGTGRPVVGSMNFSPEFMLWDGASPSQRNHTVRVAAHELLHALGFTASYISQQFRGGAGATRSTTVRGGMPVEEVTTPTVVSKARAFFGCPSITGCELENEGGEGTANSHWNRRNQMDDMMAGISGDAMRLSAITLALMQDSGWYEADFSRAESMRWGNNSGCAFLNQKCDTAASGLGTYWCDDRTGAELCTFENRGIGTCMVGTFTADLPPYYQYFAGSPRVGGTTQLMDVCPIVQAYSNRICDNGSHVPTSTEARLGFTFSPASRCFTTSADFMQDGFAGSSSPRRCFDARCPGGQRVQLRVGSGPWHDCPPDGEPARVSIPGYRGTVNCPRATRFCDASLFMPDPTPPGPTPPPRATTTRAPVTTTTTPSAGSTTEGSSTTTTTATTTLMPATTTSPASTAAATTTTPAPPPATTAHPILWILSGVANTTHTPNAAAFRSGLASRLGVAVDAVEVLSFDRATGAVRFALLLPAAEQDEFAGLRASEAQQLLGVSGFAAARPESRAATDAPVDELETWLWRAGPAAIIGCTALACLVGALCRNSRLCAPRRSGATGTKAFSPQQSNKGDAMAAEQEMSLNLAAGAHPPGTLQTDHSL